MKNKIMTIITPLFAGIVFGLGLLISGMANPAKVRGFLDVFGDWQPALIAVMASAIVIFALAYHFSSNLKQPWFHKVFYRPSVTVIDARLLMGAALFGIGWGMVGLCPGPALLNVMTGQEDILIFVLALLVGNRMAHFFVGPAK
ncbi:MAG: putative membrane protein YedE/YeeE [Oleispira sp.]|jgi:uncharacterized membrane protein YedE/YeeE